MFFLQNQRTDIWVILLIFFLSGYLSRAKVYGLDLSPDLIRCARENVSLADIEVDLIEGDTESLPYPDNMFDAVLF